jgi:hypothetical protein
MPISIDQYKTPKLTKLENRYPISYDKTDRFNEICPRHEPSRYRGSEGREGGWKFGGYNPNHQTTSKERFNIRADDITLRPY